MNRPLVQLERELEETAREVIYRREVYAIAGREKVAALEAHHRAKLAHQAELDRLGIVKKDDE